MALPALSDHLAAEGIVPRGIEAFEPSQIVDFIHGILISDCRMDARKRLEHSVTEFFDTFAPETRFFLALMRDGRLCGFTAVDRYNDSTATLKWIFVRKDERGKGMGSWLLDRALSFSRTAGYEKVILCTATEMETAHRLYRSKGFVFKQWVTFWQQRMQVYENVLHEAAPSAR